MILVAEKLHQCGLLATFSSSSPHQTLATGHFLFTYLGSNSKNQLLLQGYTIRILLWTFVQSFKVSLAFIVITSTARQKDPFHFRRCPTFAC